MTEAMDKISRIGGLTQETFHKNEFVPLKLDYDSYAIRTKLEDEKKEKEEEERREKMQALTKKSSKKLFKEKLYAKDNIKKITTVIESNLNAPIKKLINS